MTAPPIGLSRVPVGDAVPQVKPADHVPVADDSQVPCLVFHEHGVRGALSYFPCPGEQLSGSHVRQRHLRLPAEPGAGYAGTVLIFGVTPHVVVAARLRADNHADDEDRDSEPAGDLERDEPGGEQNQG